jgi:hypothetical protein
MDVMFIFTQYPPEDFQQRTFYVIKLKLQQRLPLRTVK